MTPEPPPLSWYLCARDEIEERLQGLDPRAYDESRNHLDGAVTWSSPFLTHGIIDTQTVAESVLARNKPSDCYRLLFELAWREYFHRVWQQQGHGIFQDMRQPQAGQPVPELPRAILDAQTGISVVDRCLEHLQREGLMHNHARLWVAGIVCNMAHTHWFEPAKWFHYHLLDGDLASNTLSWQWVAGTFSNKAYVANQDNINRYSSSHQKNSWLDVPYEAFENFPIPAVLAERVRWQSHEPLPVCLDTLLPGAAIEQLTGSVALYSLWHLDPTWQPRTDRRILFLDTDWHQSWPMSEKRWAMIRYWADVLELEIFHGTLADLHQATAGAKVLRREYPACQQWPGTVEPRRWLYPLPDKPFNSFSKFWKLVRGSAGL